MSTFQWSKEQKSKKKNLHQYYQITNSSKIQINTQNNLEIHPLESPKEKPMERKKKKIPRASPTMPTPPSLQIEFEHQTRPKVTYAQLC